MSKLLGEWNSYISASVSGYRCSGRLYLEARDLAFPALRLFGVSTRLRVRSNRNW